MSKNKTKTKKPNANDDAERWAGRIVGNALARSSEPKGWDMSNGRQWVVVAFWGTETTVTFHASKDEASDAYLEAFDNGADAFYAKASEVSLQSER